MDSCLDTIQAAAHSATGRIRAAAKEDQQALLHLRATAQSDSSNTHSMSDCDFWDLTISCWRHPAIAAQHPYVAACMPVMSDRRTRFTMDRLQTAARQGRLAELQWLRAPCQPTDP